jgi:type IV pilus assembly protein PilM
MAAVKTVWGIDVGKCALKALKLHQAGEELRVEAFDVIEHPKILSQPDADRDQLLRNALEQFLARNNVSDSRVVVAAPGQSGFARFVKLPPVEPRQVPEIVRFEAEQQIPFNINEVIWRWQAFVDPDSPDIEVGIFAMKRTDVSEVLDRFSEVGITVDTVQMAPLALYNFLDYDDQAAGDGASLLVDVGAEKTDLVVSDGPRIWTRTLQLGGNNFTEALVKAFKLSFSKAEKLKRTAATSKYARQIFQAMRPVFAELVQEIQRSIGHYTSLHRESRFKRVVGLGNGFRLPGLQKFLEQNLSIPVVRVDSFNRLSPSPAVNAPAFTENVPSFAVAYGLALQGLGLTKIQTDLLPSEITRRRRWAKKRVWFAAAGAMVLLALSAVAWRAYTDKGTLNPAGNADLRAVEEVVRISERLQNQYGQVKGQDQAEEAKILRYMDMEAYHYVWPALHFMVSKSIALVATQQGLMNPAGVSKLTETRREERRVVMVESLTAVHEGSLAALKEGNQTLEMALRTRYARAGGGGPGPSGGPMYGPMYVPVPETPAPVPAPVMVPTPAPPVSYGTGTQTPSPAQPGAAKPPAAGAAEAPTPRAVYLVYMKGTTPQRDSNAVHFLSTIKNTLADVARDFPALEVAAGDIVSVRTPPKAVAPSEAAGAPGRYTAPPTVTGGERPSVDPLTAEPSNEDTEFVLGWVVVVWKDGLEQVREALAAAAGGAK